MDEILKFIERVHSEEKHSKTCRGITSYTDGVDSWDKLDLNKCNCDRWRRIYQRIAEMWYADRARPMKDLIGRCTCGHPESKHHVPSYYGSSTETWCNLSGCQCATFKEIK